MTDFDRLKSRYRRFIEERDWEQFHTPKNAAIAVSVEAGELLELFLWHDNLDADRIGEDDELVERIRSEVADVVIYCLSIAIHLDFDLLAAVEEKLDENEERFDDDTSAEITEELQRWTRSDDS